MTILDTLSIVRAQGNDIETLNHISIESKMYWGYPPEWLEHWKEELSITEYYLVNNDVYKIVKGEEIIGFISIEDHQGTFEIAHLWILPKYIGKGYGKKLLTEAIARVVTPGSEVIVVADPHAESFYQHQGFVTFKRIESAPKGRFLPVMKKTKH